MSVVHVTAPAKINLTLEALGRRNDGYHEIRTIMQTISLVDDIMLDDQQENGVQLSGDYEPGGDDLIYDAVAALQNFVGEARGVRIKVTKRIPMGAGLGGGSTDAAAVLRGLRRLWEIDITDAQLAEIAAGIGSDETFFLHGGTALAEGRGEKVSPLPGIAESWFVILAPPLSLPDKTARMYAALTEADYSDGLRTTGLARKIANGTTVASGDLYNVFDRAAGSIFPELLEYRAVFAAAAGRDVHLTGAGPGLYALADGPDEARAIVGRLGEVGGQAFAVSSLAAENAVAI